MQEVAGSIPAGSTTFRWFRFCPHRLRPGTYPFTVATGVRTRGRHLKTEARTKPPQGGFSYGGHALRAGGCTPSAFRAGGRRCRDDFRHPLRLRPTTHAILRLGSGPRGWDRLVATTVQVAPMSIVRLLAIDASLPSRQPAGSGWCGTASLRLTDEGGGYHATASAWTSRTRYRPLRARAGQHRASGPERTNTGTHAQGDANRAVERHGSRIANPNKK